jgi:hypothetical protein
MASVKVLTDFSKVRDAALPIHALSIVEKMTGNENYPSPVPTLDEVRAAIDAYNEAHALGFNSGMEKTFIKRTKRRELEDLLQSLAWYVQAHCRNDRTILLSSGFDPRRPRGPVGVLDRPSRFSVEDGYGPGSIKLRVAKISGASSYIFEYATMPVNDTTQWTTRVGTARTCVIEGLSSGTRYAFRVAGAGADRNRVYSDVFTRYAQ